MNEITQERADQLANMFKYLASRSYSVFYEDNSYDGRSYITFPCSYQRYVLREKNRDVAELTQKNGLFYYREI